MIKVTQLALLFLLMSACTLKQPESDWHTNSWNLVPAQSQLSFVTTKNKTISEEHTLKFKSGMFDDSGFKLTVNLNTIDTQIPIRDERMKEMLFETDDFPLATITGQIPAGLNMGQTAELTFVLDLHGIQQEMLAEVMIQQVDGQLVVTNFEPITVNAKDFDLDHGVNELTRVAQLQSINYEVLVDFKLVFEM
mgnify:CR=1 FL=1